MSDSKKPPSKSITDISVPPINLRNMPCLPITPLAEVKISVATKNAVPQRDRRVSIVEFLLRQRGAAGPDHD